MGSTQDNLTVATNSRSKLRTQHAKNRSRLAQYGEQMLALQFAYFNFPKLIKRSNVST